MCYSSPNAVGPIADLEWSVIDIVDEYVKNNMNDELITTIDDEMVENIFKHVLEEINVNYLKFTIRTRLEEIKDEHNDKYNKKHKPLFEFKFERESLDERFYQFDDLHFLKHDDEEEKEEDNNASLLYLDEIEELTQDEQRLNDLIIAKLKELNDGNGQCSYTKFAKHNDKNDYQHFTLTYYYWIDKDEMKIYKTEIEISNDINSSLLESNETNNKQIFNVSCRLIHDDNDY